MTAESNSGHTHSTSSREQVGEVAQRPLPIDGIISSGRSLTRKHGPFRQTTGAQSIPSRAQTQRGESSREHGGGLGSNSGDLYGDMGHDQWSSPGSADVSPGPGPEPFNQGCFLNPSQQEHVSSENLPFVEGGINDPPDSTVRESDISGFVLSTETRLCDTVVEGDRVDETSEALEPDRNTPVEIQFNPEDFNFDISKSFNPVLLAKW